MSLHNVFLIARDIGPSRSFAFSSNHEDPLEIMHVNILVIHRTHQYVIITSSRRCPLRHATHARPRHPLSSLRGAGARGRAGNQSMMAAPRQSGPLMEFNFARFNQFRSSSLRGASDDSKEWRRTLANGCRLAHVGSRRRKEDETAEKYQPIRPDDINTAGS